MMSESSLERNLQRYRSEMFYLAAYLTVGLAVAIAMALIQGRRDQYPDEPDAEHTPIVVYVLIGLAWPVSAIAFCYGLLSHLLTRTAPGDRVP